MYKYISEPGGNLKKQDNIIGEILPNGEKYIRFKPVAASNTRQAMETLCNFLNNDIQEQKIKPLILIGAFVLDLLCIHPFSDGNVRISRLLTLLLLYKYDYQVGRYISFEKIIEDSKSSYYKTLKKSSVGWHEGEHNLFFWL